MRYWIHSLIAVGLVLGAGVFAGAAAAEHSTFEHSALMHAQTLIRTDDLQQYVDVLADDTFEGREGGSRGGRAAGGYLVRFFQKYGLRGLGDQGGYFQPFGNGFRNILGLLEGSDPQLKHEIVLIGAHYDHVGYGSARNSYGPTGYIHNGADDNASGTAAVLEIMEAFCSLPERPKRSVLFALWDGEEQGLLGSEHFVSQPAAPVDRIVLAINIDMIGRMRAQRLEVFGARTGAGLRKLLSESNQSTRLRLAFDWELKSNSDHYTFVTRSIPVVMFHTGLHEDYHRPSDDAHKVNPEGIQQVARLIFRFAWDLSERRERPAFRSRALTETPEVQKALEQPLPDPRPRLGIAWEEHPDTPGLLVTRVTSGSAAGAAGLQSGWRLLKIDGRPIENSGWFRQQILAASERIVLTVARSESETPVEMPVTLRGTPSRVGIAWREDAGEPGSVILVRVVRGSPAEVAGLAVGDRLYAVNGRPFASGAELLERIAAADKAMTFTIERNGILSRTDLHLPQ